MKIGILFGAGAEIVFGLSSGKDFSKKVLGLNVEKMNEAVANYYKSQKLKDWYPSYRKYTWDKEKLIKAALKKKYLEDSNNETSKRSYDEVVEEQYKQIINKSEKEQNDLLDKHTSYMGILDEKFHTLISPKELGPGNFWKVIDTYTRAYLTLVEKMVSGADEVLQEEDKFSWILKNPKKANQIVEDYCKNNCSENNSYYRIIREKTKKNNIRIITTNYTPLSGIITGIGVENVAYLHGRLNWFESPYEWKVYDVLKDDLPNEELLFPYIFVQSGIKPIVEERILMEYSKAIKYLNEVEKLIVVGYRFNYDDNHINSLIRSYILKGKNIVYLDFDNEKEWDVLKRLHLNLESSKNNFRIVHINENNSLDIFIKEINKNI